MKVRLTDYQNDWPLKFKQEAENLKYIFGDEVIRFEHFGSTAVPGMKAKPVIDMMCLVHDIERIDSYNGRMESLEYNVAGEWGIPGRRLFRKGGENRTHHIHVYQYDHPEIERHLILRDYLKANPDEAEKYSLFKERLAEQYEHTRDYSPAKKEYVSRLEQRALQWYSEMDG